MSTSSRARRALLALGLGLLAGCQNPLASETVRPQLARPAAGKPAPAVVRHDPQVLPLPLTAGRALVEVSSGKLLTGQAALQALNLPFFEDSGAAYRLQALALNRTLVTATSLEEDLYVKGGQAIMGASDAAGQFKLIDAPADRAFVLSVQLAASHRLSAIVPVGANTAEVDEGTSMVAEMARWQIRSAKPADGSEADRTTMADLPATTVAALHLKSRDFVFPADLDPGEGPVPSVDALKVGAGHVLRNRYVAAFGSRITAAGDTVADWLSDAWRDILGYRPLALTRVAGNGRRGANQNDGLLAAESSLTGPNDAVADAAGHVVIAEEDEHLLRYVPAADLPGGVLGYPGPMQAGRIYTVAGVVNGPPSLADFDGFYQPIEASAAADPAEAPPLAVGFPIYSPYRVALANGDMFFTSRFGHRVFFVPGSNVTGRYGRDFLGGRLYTLAGHGAPRGGDLLEPERQDYLYGEGAPGLEANLSEPTGLAVDQAGNVYLLDSGYAENELADAIASDETDATYTFPNPGASGRTILVYHGTIRIVRASDGAIVTLKLTLGGQAFPVTGAQDLQLVEKDGVRTLYVADTNKHWVFKVEVPADLTATPLTAAITPVLGTIDEPGYVRNGVDLPDAFHAFDGVPLADARLNGPTSLTFDQEGRLIVADAGTRRVRLLDQGKVYTIAGGFDTRYLEGDARLGYMPQTTSVRLDPDGNLLLVDRKEQLVRKIWTRRGSL